MEYKTYTKKEVIFEERPGFDPNQYVLPLKLDQYKIKFPTEPEIRLPSDLEKKILKNENTS